MKYHCIRHKLQTASGRSWQEMAEELFTSAAMHPGTMLRLVLFSEVADNEEYRKRKTFLEQLSAVYFSSPRPLVTLIAQKPLTADLLVDMNFVTIDGIVTELTIPSGRYLRIEADDYREIIGGSLCTDDLNLSVRRQSEIAFQRMKEILTAEGMTFGDVVRQWNYLERITDYSSENQHYQDFNDIRSSYYSSSDWRFGYPAATGIGTNCGGVQIDFNAVKGNVEILPLDNDWQRAAHVYSDEVLVSRSLENKETPKFERGKLLADDTCRMTYVSGTAAILGENSVEAGILSQLEITLKNIQHLIGLEEGLDKLSFQAGVLQQFRVYLKNEEDVAVVRKELDKYGLSIPIAYLLADVCREELLIEIEGTAIEMKL